MNKKTFKRFCLIATFSIFTIASASINYCFGWKECDAPITHPEPPCCENCGNTELKEKCEIWHDGVDFHIHTYVCDLCGFWYVYYN